MARLAAFLGELSVQAAKRMQAELRAAIQSLGDNPGRGRAGPSLRERELPMRFGKAGYVIRYQIKTDEVVVSRIWHSRERRR